MEQDTIHAKLFASGGLVFIPMADAPEIIKAMAAADAADLKAEVDWNASHPATEPFILTDDNRAKRASYQGNDIVLLEQSVVLPGFLGYFVTDHKIRQAVVDAEKAKADAIAQEKADAEAAKSDPTPHVVTEAEYQAQATGNIGRVDPIAPTPPPVVPVVPGPRKIGGEE